MDCFLTVSYGCVSSDLCGMTLCLVHCSILQNLWCVTVKTLRKTVETVPHRENVIYLFKRLYHALQMSRDFYHAGGDGLSDEVLDSEDYKVGILNYDLKFDVLSILTFEL